MAAQSSTRTNRHISKASSSKHSLKGHISELIHRQALALETCKHLERQTPSPKIDA